MNEAIKKHREELESEMEQLQEVREDVLLVKADINLAGLSKLLSTLKDGIEELNENDQKKEYYDKGLCGALKSTVTELVSAFSKIKQPVINVAAPSIDFSQLKSIASDISGQNKVLVNLIERLNSTNDNGELYRLVTAMIGRQNAFIEKGFQAANYTDELKRIGDGLNKNPIEYAGKITKRTHDRLIDEFSIKPKA